MGSITSEHLALTDHEAEDHGHRIKLYEELEGGIGREIFFRPHRYTPEHFAPLDIWTDISIENALYHCKIVDLSQSGLGIIWPCRTAPNVNDLIDDLVVHFDEQIAYVGKASVSVLREHPNGCLVGLDLQDGLIKIDTLLQTRDLKMYHLNGDSSFGAQQQPWQIDGHHVFKSLVGELKLFLDDWQSHFNRIEQQASWDLLRFDDDHPTRKALTELVHRDFMPSFLSKTEDIFNQIKNVDEDSQQALIAFTQRYLDAYFMSAPWMHRARTKPLGYPGDYEVMNHIYGARMAGRSLLGQAINYASLHSPAAQAVRNRKDMIKNQLRYLCQTSRAIGSTRIRILSVASGPAQEIYELLQECDTLSADVDIVLFDQDPAALAFAYGRLKELVDRKWSNRVRLVYLHDSIRRLLEDSEIFSGFGHFDAIICSGLYDYLRHPVAVKLTSHMYTYCKEGGQVFIGNMVPDNPSRWIMEHHLEWRLLYRTHEEILSFAKEACPYADLRIIEESTHVNPFVVITKSIHH